MNIQYPTEQMNKPVIDIVTDKGVLLLNSFAEYAVAFLKYSVHQ
ncbi:hypothetical protein M2263_002984 [Providencia alcalifaciens]|nr:hypothetical protein [Providencia alcalifaciens]